ncbi:hypothetical protein TRFO_29352 [Tritrichomonas foetus]|uniref:Uncharacterized protein n=1 Tax=Tritrichomonas foetus TaxID=1144522 RepID=A0A1J4K0N3_9EUKA|nr:hypothetical protein TRFO_29352 [Tritrichomonas foetus]|eukprot:OHT03308.1 hypothetical protein TRFO_29352 [Tritrichomonas foetus]
MSSNDIVKRYGKYLLECVNQFICENKESLENVESSDQLQTLIRNFRTILENRIKIQSAVVAHKIDIVHDDIIWKTKKIQELRAQKAKEQNVLIINNQKYKRNIKERKKELDIDRKYKENEKMDQDYDNNCIYFNNQIQKYNSAIHKIHKLIEGVNDKDFDQIQTAIHEYNYKIHDEFQLIRYSILNYKDQAIKYYNEGKKAMQEKEKLYLSSEIARIKKLSQNIRNGQKILFRETRINKPCDLREQVENEMQKTVYLEVKKLFKAPPILTTLEYSQLISQEIQHRIYLKDEQIISSLRQKEMNCKEIKNKLKKIKAKIPQDRPVLWSQQQADIAHNLHEIKLHQANFFKIPPS